jgi:hypothetical protein
VVDGQNVLRTHPFVWSAASGSLHLANGTPFFDRSPYATDINDSGQVVGSMQDLHGARGLFYWDTAEGMHDMAGLIDPNDPLLGRLSFTDPFPHVNRWGHVVVSGRIDGVEHALLLAPVR